MASDDRAAVQAGVDVKVMLTFRLAEALGVDESILDFDDLCDRVRALAAPSPAVEDRCDQTAHDTAGDIAADWPDARLVDWWVTSDVAKALGVPQAEKPQP